MASRVRGGHKARSFLRRAQRASTPPTVDVGFFSHSKYEDGTPVAAVAAWNEFGTQRIPERPFFRRAIEAEKGPNSQLRQIVKQRVDPQTLAITNSIAGLLGAAMQGTIQKEITTLRQPPNAALTIRLKGSSNPLIDTEHMRNSVTWKVEG